MSEIWTKTAKIFVTISIIVGIFTIANTAHEFSHFWDIKDTVIVEEICVLNIPIKNPLEGAIGYVEYQDYGEKAYSSELKATLIGLIVGGLLVCCLGYTLSQKKKEVE